MENEKSKSEKKTKNNLSKNVFKIGILSLIGAIFHKLVLSPIIVFLGFSTYMISYLRYYQNINEKPISLNYSYFVMPILSVTMGVGIIFSGILEFKLGTKLIIIYSSLYLILSSIILYFSKNIAMNLFAVFTFAVGISLSFFISGKNACMYFPQRRGTIPGFLAFISAAFSSILNIFGEKVIINPKSIEPDGNYYIYDVAKNIKKYYLFQIGSVVIFTILSVLFIIEYKMKSTKKQNKQQIKKKMI